MLLANAWLGDDGHITYRVVDNFVRGYGLTLNPPERVQVYTHPLWMLVLVPIHFVTREFAVSVTMLSRALGCATMVVLLRWEPMPWRAARCWRCCRFFVNARQPVLLERVEISGTPLAVTEPH